MASNRKERQLETHFKVMRLLQEVGSITSREIACRFGISNGSAYYCVAAIVDKGFVRLQNFGHSCTKANYLYELTPRGIRAKASLTVQFRERKRFEYDSLVTEIARLENELEIDN